METTLSNKQKLFNIIHLTADDELYIKIDVHKKSYHIALWLNNTPAINFVMPPVNEKVVTAMARKLAVNLWKILRDREPYIRQA